MRTAAYQVDEKDILERIFSFFVNRGLENVTIRELSKGTGLVQGTLYYWFGDKTNIICESAEYGLKKVTDEIFDYVFANMNDLRGFFSRCLGEISRYKNELRFIYQMAASPVYGEKIRERSKDFNLIYDRYAHKLAVVLQCGVNALRPLVYLFISAVLDYVIWEEKEKSQIQLECIYSVLIKSVIN